MNLEFLISSRIGNPRMFDTTNQDTQDNALYEYILMSISKEQPRNPKTGKTACRSQQLLFPDDVQKVLGQAAPALLVL